MSRFILAIPAAALASLTVYNASSPTSSSGVASSPSPSPSPPSSSPARKTTRAAPTPTSRGVRAMPSRFQLEDPDAVLKELRELRAQRPPVGEAALHSGLGVELSTW